ncbi:MAG: GNAT family N-acetyltransferase [Paracoccaceae bacterium]
MDKLRTERLFWRPPGPEDIDAYQALVSDYEVVRWTASWPFPAEREFTASRSKPIDPERGFIGLVHEGDRLIGSAGVTDQVLGYMFCRDAWGRGYATEMARALLAQAFARYDWPVITAGVWHGNPASERVLAKLGFVRSGRSDGFCRAENRERTGDAFTLTRDAFARASSSWPNTPGGSGRAAPSRD